jgi:hypothetical protein
MKKIEPAPDEIKLIKRVVESYANAEEVHYYRSNIFRGRIHTVWSKVEDLFAHYISTFVNNSALKYYIDFPVSYKTSKIGKRLYPDILIVSNTYIKQIWDVKLDLGFGRRDIVRYLKYKSRLMEKLKGQKVAICIPQSTKGKKDPIGKIVSKNVSYNVVVISSTNGNKEYKKAELQVDRMPNVSLMFLTNDIHPNQIRRGANATVRSIISVKGFKKIKRKLIKLR